MVRPPKTHQVKSWCYLFQAFLRGEKTHDLRIMDRDYEVGDILLLQEYDKQQEKYTEREIEARITHITSDKHTPCAFSPQALADNFCILSLRKLSDEQT